MNALLEELITGYPDLANCRSDISEAGTVLLRQFRAGHQLLVAGNGGSAADAEHIVGELMKGCALPRPLAGPVRERLEAMGARDIADLLQTGLPAIALSSHPALMTAIINDIDGTMVFAQQVLGYGKPGDVLWAISTSGNSADIVAALKVAKAIGMYTLGLSGQDGGQMAAHCDVVIRVPYQSTQKIQERHLPIYHMLCLWVEEQLFGT